MRAALRAKGAGVPVRALAAIAVALALPVAFALAESPEVAAIFEPALGGAPLNPADVHMEAQFVDADGDGHLCTDWEIWTVPGGEAPPPAEAVWQAHCVTAGQEKLHIHLGDGEFVGSHTGRSALLPDADYELRVRFKDDSEEADEWSEWVHRSFGTRSPEEEGTESPVPWLPRPGYSVEVFATDFQLPVNIAMVPDPGPHPGDPLLYVTELYGTIKVVSRDGTVGDYATGLLNFNPTGNFPGSGEMGLTGLVVDPGSGDLFASLLHEEGGLFYPRVIRLQSDERGLAAEGQSTVLAMDEPQGASHQVSNLSLGPDGNLYVHNGEGGNRLAAQDLDSYLGKVLRMTPGGAPLADNPFYDASVVSAEDYVWAYGLRNPFGGAWRLADGAHYMVENGPVIDRLAEVVAGTNYKWPEDETMSHGALYNWAPPHAPVNIEFVEPGRFGGSGFPAAAMGNAFVTESGPTYMDGPRTDGKRISEFGLDATGGLTSGPAPLVEYTGTGKATAVALAAGADGLYFSDLYKDQDYESPIDRGSNVLLVRYCGDSCPTEEELPPVVPSPPGPPAADAADRNAPQVLGFRVERGVFTVGGGGGPRASALQRGTAFLYHLSEAATARIEVDRLGHPGPRGTLPAGGRAGPNRRPFGGFLGRRPLPPGRYRATIRTSDAGGNRSAPRSLRFRVVSAPRGRAQ